MNKTPLQATRAQAKAAAIFYYFRQNGVARISFGGIFQRNDGSVLELFTPETLQRGACILVFASIHENLSLGTRSAAEGIRVHDNEYIGRHRSRRGKVPIQGDETNDTAFHGTYDCCE